MADTEKQDLSSLSDTGKQRLLSMSEISLWLDTYDDIFSDFDPRPYSQRSLSQDFLEESQRAARGKVSGEIELTFLIPASKRNVNDEAVIKKRLKDYFKRHLDAALREYGGIIRQGVLFTALGISLMLIATWIILNYLVENFTKNFLVVLLEPAGWFFLWGGLDMIIFESKKMKPNVEFHEKMSKCEIRFLPY